MLNYVSSHDTQLFDRAKMVEAGTALLLAPGAAQIFYGDEVARSPGIAPKTDPQQATRSDMPWEGEGVNADVLAHWRALGAFRRRHVAVAHGAHARLSEAPYVFSRVDEERGDRVVVGIDVPAAVVTVGTVFAEGQALRDGYTGTPYVVHGGKVVVEEASRVVLLERGGGR
jgi:alpha-amylase